MNNTQAIKINTLYTQILALAFLLVFGVASSGIAIASEVARSADEVSPLLIGQSTPKVTLIDPQGKKVKLNKLIAEKPTLLVFYRGGWCPYCNLHLSALRKVEQPLADMGFQIVAISPDQPKYLAETGSKNELGYVLLSDSSAEAAKAFGLAFKVDAPTNIKLKGYGIDLERNSGQNHNILPVPAAYLIDREGLVHFSFVAPNYKVRVDNDVILAGAKALIKSTNK